MYVCGAILAMAPTVVGGAESRRVCALLCAYSCIVWAMGGGHGGRCVLVCAEATATARPCRKSVHHAWHGACCTSHMLLDFFYRAGPGFVPVKFTICMFTVKTCKIYMFLL